MVKKQKESVQIQKICRFVKKKNEHSIDKHKETSSD